MRLLEAAIAVWLAAAPASGWEVFCLNVTGKGPHGFLPAGDPRPLSHYQQNVPWLSEAELSLSWDDARAYDVRAETVELGAIGELQVFEIAYRLTWPGDPDRVEIESAVVLAGPGPDELRPVYVTNTHRAVIARVEPAEWMDVQGERLLRLGLRYSGTGGHRRDDLFGLHEGELVHLRLEEADRELRDRIAPDWMPWPHHRWYPGEERVGFDVATLTGQAYFVPRAYFESLPVSERKPSAEMAARARLIRHRYRVEGGRVRLSGFEILEPH